MNKKPRLGPDSPFVQNALAGIYKSGWKIFFRINPDGQHQKISVSKALNVLDIPYENKVSLIHTFPFPELAYSSERMKVNVAATAKKIAREVDEENDGADSDLAVDMATGKSRKNQRYHLIRQGNYFGSYDGQDGTLVLFRTCAEAQQFIHKLLHRREGFTAFYNNNNKSDY
jgi:hypothetical protein